MVAFGSYDVPSSHIWAKSNSCHGLRDFLSGRLIPQSDTLNLVSDVAHVYFEYLRMSEHRIGSISFQCASSESLSSTCVAM
jgi:hypothetical protein